MSENSRPNFHPSSLEAQVQDLIQTKREKVQFNKDLVRTLEAENDVLEEVMDELLMMINPPEPKDPGITSSLAGATRAAAGLPVYPKGYSSMQAQAEAHAAQVRAEDSSIAQGRAMKDNPQA